MAKFHFLLTWGQHQDEDEGKVFILNDLNFTNPAEKPYQRHCQQ